LIVLTILLRVLAFSSVLAQISVNTTSALPLCSARTKSSKGRAESSTRHRQPPPPVASPPVASPSSHLCRLDLSGLATSTAVVRAAARLPSTAHHPCSIRSPPWRHPCSVRSFHGVRPGGKIKLRGEIEQYGHHEVSIDGITPPDNPFCNPNLISALASFTIHGFLCSPSV